MKKNNVLKVIFKVIGKIFKIGAIIAGGFLLFKKKKKIAHLFKSSNFIVAALYGLLVSLIALIYRLIIALNWIIQQAK